MGTTSYCPGVCGLTGPKPCVPQRATAWQHMGWWRQQRSPNWACMPPELGLHAGRRRQLVAFGLLGDEHDSVRGPASVGFLAALLWLPLCSFGMWSLDLCSVGMWSVYPYFGFNCSLQLLAGAIKPILMYRTRSLVAGIPPASRSMIQRTQSYVERLVAVWRTK